MSAILDKYPLAQKAHDEQCEISRFLGQPLTQDYTDYISAIGDTVETYIDDSHAAREAVLTAGIFLLGSPYAFDDVSRFETEYSPEVHDAIQDLLNLDEERVQNSLVMQRVIGVICLTNLNEALSALKKGVFPEGMTPFTTADDLWNSGDYPLLAADAPRLLATIEKLRDDVVAAKDALSGDTPTPPGMWPGGPNWS